MSGVTATRPSESLRPALVLIALVLLARVVYLVWLCPYDLVEDEAHYWLWSRYLDWSYYSKGPGIAWVIWLSTRVFGHAEWAVRLPTAIAGAIGALACAGLARDIARRAFVGDGSVATPARAAVFAGAAYMLAPAFELTGVLVTIDGCYLACWAVACWMAWRALCEGSRWAWVGLGAVLGVGFLFKYTILLLAPGIALFALVSARRASRAGGVPLRPAASWRPWMAAGAIVFALGLAPVLIWNAREGWPTVKHLLGHLGIRGGDMPVPAATGGGWSFDPIPALVYLLSPLGMFGPLAVLAAVAARRVLGRRSPATETAARARALGVQFLLWAFLPIFVFYFAVSLIAEPEQNWSIGGFVSLMVLAGWYAADELTRRRAGATRPELTGPDRPRTRPVKLLWRLGLLYGLGAALVIHFGPVVAAGLNAVARAPAVSRAIESLRGGRPPGPIVLGRLIGSRVMAAHAGRVVDDLRAANPGSRPFLMCEHYGRASQMSYYLFRQGKGDIVVLSPQSVMGGRKSQFDFWPDTSLSRDDVIGQPALLMSNDKPETVERWRAMFARVEPLATPDHKLEGEHKKDRVAFVGYGYRGVGRGAKRPAAAEGAKVQQSTP